jgi:hypothetical protein
METIKGKTKTGFEFEYDKANLNDMECIDLIGELDEKPYVLGKILKIIIGSEQKKSLYNHLRDENGHVPPEKVAEAFAEIIQASNESKNS